MNEHVSQQLRDLVRRVSTVRRWLMCIAVLKATAAALAFASLYIGIYSCLDYWLRFGAVVRCSALAVFVAGLVALLVLLMKTLVHHLSYSSAANYVDKQLSFEQQLTASIEYYENQGDYAYSPALAECLVSKVYQQSANVRFDRIVAKWQGYAYSAAIIAGLVIAGWFAHTYYAFFSSYFERLAHPLAPTSALAPETELIPITTALLAEPGARVGFAAAIIGRVPAAGALVIRPEEGRNATTDSFRVDLTPDRDASGTSLFAYATSFGKTGKFVYHFEAVGATSSWQRLAVCTTPVITSIYAEVSMANVARPPYMVAAKDYSLDVLMNANVALHVQASEPLAGGDVTMPDGKVCQVTVTNGNTLLAPFKAASGGRFTFTLVSAEGVTNAKLPTLELVLKKDDRPTLSLLSPAGDYIASPVASIPIAFAVQDDFAIEGATLHIVGDGVDKHVPIESMTSERQGVVAHTLELEQYGVVDGDSVLVYAEAQDCDTTGTTTSRVTRSDLYFVEIRAFRQDWFEKSGGGKKPAKPKKPQQGGPRETFLALLEYTRAVVRKTWQVTMEPAITAQTTNRLVAIADDVVYCDDQLGKIVSDPKAQFGADVKAAVEELRGYYRKSDVHLRATDAIAAVDDERDAYALLRKMIMEEFSQKKSQQAPPPPPQQQAATRDKVKLSERVHTGKYDEERTKAMLEDAAREIARLAEDQKQLNNKMTNALANRPLQMPVQKVTDKQPGQEQKPPSQCAGQAQGQGKGEGQEESQTPSRPDIEKQLRMLEARQTALRSQADQISKQLEDIGAQGTNDAQKALNEARAQMDEAQKALASLQYQEQLASNQLARINEAMQRAGAKLEQAAAAVESKLNKGNVQAMAQLAESLAKQLEDAAAQPQQQNARELAKAITDAEKMLQSLAPTDYQAYKAQLAQRQAASQNSAQSQPPNRNARPGQTTGPASQKPGKGPPSSPGPSSNGGGAVFGAEKGAEVELLAEYLMSAALRNKQQNSGVRNEEPSDARFSATETVFYESAAKYK